MLDPPIISGGLLESGYRLLQFHFHWATGKSNGSEHSIGGQRYTGEMHLVHLRNDLPDMNAALNLTDGLAVLAVFLHLNESLHHPTTVLAPITRCAANVTYKGEECRIQANLSLADFLPDHDNFFSYYGSLTTPPCSQTVLWTVLTQPIPVSRQTLRQLERLEEHRKGDADGHDDILFNDRPSQPVNRRPILLRKPYPNLSPVCGFYPPC